MGLLLPYYLRGKAIRREVIASNSQDATMHGMKHGLGLPDSNESIKQVEAAFAPELCAPTLRYRSSSHRGSAQEAGRIAG